MASAVIDRLCRWVTGSISRQQYLNPRKIVIAILSWVEPGVENNVFKRISAKKGSRMHGPPSRLADVLATATSRRPTRSVRLNGW